MNRFILVIFGLLFVVIGLSTLSYTISKCGWYTLLMGDRGFWLALFGVCG